MPSNNDLDAKIRRIARNAFPNCSIKVTIGAAKLRCVTIASNRFDQMTNRQMVLKIAGLFEAGLSVVENERIKRLEGVRR